MSGGVGGGTGTFGSIARLVGGGIGAMVTVVILAGAITVTFGGLGTLGNVFISNTAGNFGSAAILCVALATLGSWTGIILGACVTGGTAWIRRGAGDRITYESIAYVAGNS